MSKAGTLGRGLSSSQLCQFKAHSPSPCSHLPPLPPRNGKRFFLRIGLTSVQNVFLLTPDII